MTNFFRVAIWGYSATHCFWALYLNTESGFQLIKEEGKGQDYYYLYEDVLAGDFNGDGMSDVMGLGGSINIWASSGTSTTTELYLSTGNNVEKASTLNPAFLIPSDLNDGSICRTGDFNGDGKTDILAVAKSAGGFNGYRLYISTGTALIKVKEDTWPGGNQSIFASDYNGDGRTDMLVKADRSKDTSWDGHRLFLSTGQDFAEVLNEQWPSWTERFHPGDYDGDGRTDLLVTADKKYDNWTGYQLLQARIDQSTLIPQTMPRLLGSVTNILGTTTEITYKPSSIWPKDIDGDNTYRSMPLVLPTVSALTIHDNMAEGGHIATSTYAYEGALYDLSEREFRGFGKVTVEDQITHIAAVNYYNQEPRFQGRVQKSITLTPNGVPVVQTVNQWEAFVYSSAEETERTFAFVRSNTTTSYDDAGAPLATISTSYDYDNYGNMLVEDKSEQNHRTGDITTRFVRTQYRNDTVNWILGQPENIRTDTMDPGPPEPGNISAAALRELRMEYNPDRPWLLQHSKQVHWEEQDGVMVEQEITTTYDNDEFGNPTWISNPRNPSWGTLTDYSESNGMFPNWTTNALGHTVHWVFDPRFGAVTEETLNPADGDQQKTTTFYDEFGRPELVTHPDLTTKAFAYNIEPGNHFIRVASTLMPTVTTYYDNRDREIRVEADDGTRAIITETIYNDAGQIWKKSLPHFWDAAGEYSVSTYEPIRGRIQRQTNPDNTYRTIVYDGFNETITDENGHEKIITKDSLGRLKKVVEPTGGVTEYDYDLFGNLIWIIDPMGNQTHIAYDDLGRKIAMDDPYMGRWEYKYDAAGNLVWQKDGRDRIVTMTYDQLNRLETKTYQDTGRVIQYTYDEVRAGFLNKGGLTTLTATEPGSLFNTIAYNYDRMGRNVSETRTIDGTAYTTRRQYDAAGRLDIITYPDGSTDIDYDYHAMGHLEKVYKVEADQTRTLLAEYSGHNALGQVGSMTYGNGAVTSYDYWPGHHRLRSMQTTAQATPGSWGTIQDLEYHFDNLGNVETITDHLHGAGFDFDYDSVSRLTHARATCAGDPDREYDQAYTYDLAGNMEAKTGKGGFHVLEWEDAQKHIRPAAVVFNQNVSGVGQRHIVYNQDNKPSEVTYNGQTSYLSYDGEGNRIKKSGGGQSTIYVGGLYEISSGQAVAHVFAGGKRIASIKAGQKYYSHGDHLGSTSVVTDGNGLPVEEIGYLPFGATLFRKVYNSGTWTSVYRFTGQEYDAEYALYNYNARLYDPVLGRFISADTMVPDWSDPQSLNRYAYCRNNPLIYVDPSGHFGWIGLFVAMAYGAAIGAVVGGIMAAINGGNIWEGITQGAISGAISGAMFYCAGSFIKTDMFSSLKGVTGLSENVAKAAVHTVTGAASGAVNAAMTGGDIGQAALIGGLSAGAAEYMGGGPGARIFTGAAAGGVSSVMAGGDFAEGVAQGAWSSAIGYVCNKLAHKVLTHDPLAGTEIVKKDRLSRTADGRFDANGGTYRSRPHNGVDLVAVEGQPVYAAGNGRAVTVNSRGYGNMVEVYHKGGFVTRYAHLDTCTVDMGAKVTAGTIIGYVGRTGNLPSPNSQTHLHFEVIKNGTHIDPASIYNWGMQK